MKKVTQLTFGKYGHTLHHCQVFTPDNNWIVYDTRNEDTMIGTTTRIERVNLHTKEIEVLYEVNKSNAYGPGVGAVTCSPKGEKVIFIHGLKNASVEKPYGMARRTGVSITIDNPNIPINMDARNIYHPFTKGALRGGTHSHCWNFDGSLISFTYNDYVLSQNNIPDERVVGVMFPKNVDVPIDMESENLSGTMFSVILTTIVEKAISGSDEIEKAFDECWLGNTNNIIFQGWVRDANGNRKTEIFTVNIPGDLTLEGNEPLEGTLTSRPGVPKGVFQKRITYLVKGISEFRHWLRSSPNGEIVYFLKEDSVGCTQLFGFDLNQSHLIQYSNHESSIHSPFNISPNEDTAIYLQNNSIILLDLINHNYQVLYTSNHLYGIPNFDKKGNLIVFNQYVLNDINEYWLQIFSINLNDG